MSKMSAPEIPNLLALRGGPRQRGVRGRGRGRGGAPDRGGPFANSQFQKDLDVQATDTDASVSRLSAVSLGYLEDPFAARFVNGHGARRMPVINRGTYARTSALDILINAFLATTPGDDRPLKQIISLGAGTDTRYFRLRARQKHKDLIYHEFDFPDVSALKYATVLKKPELSQGDAADTLFRGVTPNDTTTPTIEDPEWGFKRQRHGAEVPGYCFHPMDLRQLPHSSGSGRGLESFHGIRNDVPTLLISECCLCYLAVDTASDVVKFFSDRIPSLGIILYEPIGVNDAFGQTMVTNLAARNITMPTVQQYKDLADQKQRLADLGFKEDAEGQGGTGAENIDTIWNDWIPADEKRRVDRLEGLDEVEEWQVIARHYAVVWGWKGDGWNGWAGLRSKS